MNKSSFIAGKWQSLSGPNFNSIDPSYETVIWQGCSASQVDIDKAVQSADSAFNKWSRLSLNDRYNILSRFNSKLTQYAKILTHSISLETGKPFWESHEEVTSMSRTLTQALDSYKARCKEKDIFNLGSLDCTRFRARGIMAILGTFNLPGRLPNEHIIPALLAGNTVIFKPSEKTPNSSVLACFSGLVALDTLPGFVI